MERSSKNNSSDSLEEGEIVDYEPIPRPQDLKRVNTRAELSSNDNSDSDSDTCLKFKRARTDDKKKYSVWSGQVDDSQLVDDISKWDTGTKSSVVNTNRDVESYSIPKTDVKKDSQSFLKRQYGERSSVKSRLGPRPVPQQTSGGHSRFLSSLRVSAEDSVEDVAQDILNKLCEEKEDLVVRIVEVLGQQKAIAFYEQTKDVEEKGGMLVMNGSRRRTPGGVYLQLIKRSDTLTPEQIRQIFYPPKTDSKSRYKGYASRSTSYKRDIPTLSRRVEIPHQSCLSTEHKKTVKNPPPSPATDGEQVEKRKETSYDDDLYHLDAEMDFA